VNAEENCFTSALFIDNINAVRAVTNKCLGQRTCHIAIHIAWVTKVLEKYKMQAVHISSVDNCADAFTKQLPFHLFARQRSSLRLIENFDELSTTEAIVEVNIAQNELYSQGRILALKENVAKHALRLNCYFFIISFVCY
jgi:Fe-S-cluster-containing dehydrogenase component